MPKPERPPPRRVRLKPEYADLPDYRELNPGKVYLARFHRDHADFMHIVEPPVSYAQKRHFDIDP